MHATDRFMRFAAECKVMAKTTRNPEDRAIWNGLAQRWLRCAEFMDREQPNVHHASLGRRQRTFLHNTSH